LPPLKIYIQCFWQSKKEAAASSALRKAERKSRKNERREAKKKKAQACRTINDADEKTLDLGGGLSLWYATESGFRVRVFTTPPQFGTRILPMLKIYCQLHTTKNTPPSISAHDMYNTAALCHHRNAIFHSSPGIKHGETRTGFPFSSFTVGQEIPWATTAKLTALSSTTRATLWWKWTSGARETRSRLCGMTLAPRSTTWIYLSDKCLLISKPYGQPWELASGSCLGGLGDPPWALIMPSGVFPLPTTNATITPPS
jgi:hypothetical protein